MSDAVTNPGPGAANFVLFRWLAGLLLLMVVVGVPLGYIVQNFLPDKLFGFIDVTAWGLHPNGGGRMLTLLALAWVMPFLASLISIFRLYRGRVINFDRVPPLLGFGFGAMAIFMAAGLTVGALAS